MSFLFLALWPLAAAQAQQAVEIRRGDLPVEIRVHGTVVAEDLIRLRSTIAGRVEEVLVSSGAWALKGRPLGKLVNRELAAMLDSRTPATRKESVEESWGSTYAPAEIACPRDCFVLRSFVKPKQWVQPQAVLFEAAQRLTLVGRVRPEDAHWIRDGQALEFWPSGEPAAKLKAAVSHYLLDVQGQRGSGGSFAIDMPPSRHLPPATQWEGRIVPLTKRGVLLAPTRALLEHDGAVYLPVKVSTGITTEELTEITAGVEARRAILVPGESQDQETGRHKPEIDEAALERRLREQEAREKARPAAPPASAPQAPPADKSKALPDIGADYGADPYAQ